MASKKTVTDYESQRLENIRRNSEMLAALKVHSKVSEFSASLKRGSSLSTNYPSKSKRFKCSPPRSPVVIRRSLRTRGLPPDQSSDVSTLVDNPISPSPKHTLPSARSRKEIFIADAFIGEGISSDRSLLGVILNAATAGGYDDGESSFKLKEAYEFDPMSSMILKPENVARVLPDRILSVRFLPSANRTIVAVGNKLGNVGFWDLDFISDNEDEEESGIYVYAPHSGPVSGICVHPSSMSKIFTASYDGFVRKMDIDKETFNATYSTENTIFSICQRPCEIGSIYIGEGAGVLKLWDDSAGKALNHWNLHENRINTIDFNQENLNLMATGSSDGTACIWDLRSMNKKKPEPLKLVRHKRAVNSAYFSPNGTYLATTSLDDRIGILNLSQSCDVSMIPHNNMTGRWLSTFRAIWGWDDSFLFLGNMGRALDIVSTSSKATTSLSSHELSAIPCRFAAHQCRIGTLAGATSGGKVFLWTKC